MVETSGNVARDLKGGGKRQSMASAHSVFNTFHIFNKDKATYSYVQRVPELRSPRMLICRIGLVSTLVLRLVSVEEYTGKCRTSSVQKPRTQAISTKLFRWEAAFLLRRSCLWALLGEADTMVVVWNDF